MMSPRGIDTSGENLKNADFSHIPSDIRQVDIRATAGLWVDPYYAHAMQAIKACPNLIPGAYLFLRCDIPALPQLDLFSLTVGDLVPGKDMIPALDIEFSGGGRQASGLSLQHCVDVILEAVRLLQGRYAKGVRAYSSGRVEHEDLRDELAKYPELIEMPYWDARYLYANDLAPQPAPDHYEPTPIPMPWGPGNWWQHQYQGNARGLSGILGRVDMSRFKVLGLGEVSERAKWVQRRVVATKPSDYGRIGTETQALIKSYQAARGLTPDGFVGPATFAHLSWASPSAL